MQDIFDFLSHYFIPCTGVNVPSGTGCLRSADINGVGGITVQDLFDFLSADFAASHC